MTLVSFMTNTCGWGLKFIDGCNLGRSWADFGDTKSLGEGRGLSFVRNMGDVPADSTDAKEDSILNLALG